MKPDLTNRADIQHLINTFYDKVKGDETLAYIFADVAKVDWESHLPVMYDFWESLLFQTGNYRRNAMKIHMDLNQKTPLTAAHFDKWLELFKATVDELFEGQMAHNAKTRAISIATMMQFKIHETNSLI